MREKLELWRQRTGRKPMRRFSYVAEFWPTDLSVRLTTPLVVNDKGSKSTIKRKPLCCINRSPNQINEQLNIKLCFDDDFVPNENPIDDEITINPVRRVPVESSKCSLDSEDEEITINPLRRKRNRSLTVETNVMFTSTTIRYTTSIPRSRLRQSEGFCVTPVKRSTRRRSMLTPGYLDDQRSCYDSPSEINTSEIVILPNKYLCNIDKV